MTFRRDRVFNLPPQMIGSFVLLAAMVFISLFLASRLVENIREAGRLADYRRGVGELLIAMRDAESGQRGYLLTGNKKYLAPYRNAQSHIGNSLARIDRDPLRRGAAIAMRAIVQQKNSELAHTIALSDAARRDQAIALVQSGVGEQLMQRFRAITENERAWGFRRADELTAESQTVLWQLTIALVGGAIATGILTIVWLNQARSQFQAMVAARNEARASLAALTEEAAAREESEARLRQLQKMESIGQLTGGIAHDFNNMLGVIIGGIELAKRRIPDDIGRAHRNLDHALEGANRAASLTSRLLAFSRNQPLAPAPLDANKLVARMSEMLSRTLGDAIVIETVAAAGLWRGYADPGEVENAVLNLSINARDAMPDGGKLTIETCNAYIDDNYVRQRGEVSAGQYVLISVTDTGVGMDQQVIERAFDPFFTTKEVGKGTGLGLSQVFGFAKQSGGHAAIYSEVGKGTTVKIYLPRFTGLVSDDRVHDDADLAPAGKASELVLVVEDEQRVREFAVSALEELGYSTIDTGMPEDALRIIEQRPEITLLFTDIVMPQMTGRQLADLALAGPRPDLKVLYATGYTRNAVVHNGMLDVGVAFLPKPYTIADLGRKIREVLDGGGINRPV